MQCTVWMKLREHSVGFPKTPFLFFQNFYLVSVGHKRWTDSTMSTSDIGSVFIFFMNESSWKTLKNKFHLQRQNKLPRMYSHAYGSLNCLITHKGSRPKTKQFPIWPPRERVWQEAVFKVLASRESQSSIWPVFQNFHCGSYLHDK